jgi:DNA-binding MarR family transcriptional regulator
MSIAMLLWKEAGIRNQRTVKINLSALADLGLTRATARRALQALASANLVTVSHHPGQALVVTLLETPLEIADG